MGKLKDAILSNIEDFDAKWINIDEPTSVQVEETRANTKIVLKIIQYMKTKGLKQKDLAQILEVSPQYVNKLLHGQASNISVGTAIRYGKLLGIELVSIPDEPMDKIQLGEPLVVKLEVPKKTVGYPNNSMLYNSLVSANQRYQRYGRKIS